MNVHTMAHARRSFDHVVGMRAGKVVHDDPANAIDDMAHCEETAL